ncbi:hypothetical protein BJV82DRAFT_717277 [Fennellomyces sp. T-0311]|nr:hypothetical protein BJV82DRAFT_717277 [Fennellomyces sp. T-0311]
MAANGSNSATPSIIREAPDFQRLITGYLLTAEQPTLQAFIDRNTETIASLPTPTTDLKRFWTWRYTQACQKLGKECFVGNTDCASPLEKSKYYFINQMEEAYANMWALPSGTTVEDIMIKCAREIPYEHPAHSFIFDTQDSCWDGHFSEEDLNYIRTFNAPQLPNITDDEAIVYLKLFEGKVSTTYDDIMRTLLAGPYSEAESSNVAWLRHTIMTAMMNCRKKFTDKHFSETDIIIHIWSQIIYCFADTDIDVNTGENESKATTTNKNAKRTLSDRKNHGTRTDMRFKWKEAELGSTEVGRVDEGEYGTKEFKESTLKLPKTMRDMLVEMVKSHEDKKQHIQTFGFIMMGTAIKAVIMDSIGNVCRVFRSQRYIYPADTSAFITRSTPILELFLQVKQMRLDVVDELKQSRPPASSFTPNTPLILVYSVNSPSSPSSPSTTATSSSPSVTSTFTTRNRRPRTSSSTSPETQLAGVFQQFAIARSSQLIHHNLVNYT